MLPPLPLEKFSPRAQRLLLSAQRAEVERDPEEIARRLAACHRPVSSAVIDFERTYGGLSWGEDTLGIYYEEPMPDPNDPLDLDGTMVPIGSVGVLGLFMNDAGEVYTQPNARSASIVTHLEQRAMLPRDAWRDRFVVKIRPAIGERLAEALGLAPVREATDRYQAWWEAADTTMRHIHAADVFEARVDLVVTASLDGVVRALGAAREMVADVRASVSGGGATYVELTAEEIGAFPGAESWSSVPGAVRYPYGDERDEVSGVVWVMGRPGAWEIQEVVMGAGGVPREWITYGEGVAVARDLRGRMGGSAGAG